MLYTLIAIVIALLAAVLAYRGIKILIFQNWFMGFCRGVLALALLGVALAIGVLAYDVFSYKQILQEQAVATISFDQIDDQHYDAVLVTRDGKEKHYDLRGDQWQLDARVIKWKGYFSTFGIKPAYRLERLSGRYYDIEQETTAKRTAYAVNESLYGVDLWKLLNKNPAWVPVIDATYGSATYLPMRDKAVFEVTLSNTGLLARPVNVAAQEAMAEFN